MPAENVFIGRSTAPSDADLVAAMGPVEPLWKQLLDELMAELPGIAGEWYSYSIKAGWSYRLKLRKRTIVYVIPSAGSFRVAFVFGGKALEAIRAGSFSKELIQAIDEAKKYAEGTGVNVEVRNAGDVRTVCQLARIKHSF